MPGSTVEFCVAVMAVMDEWYNFMVFRFGSWQLWLMRLIGIFVGLKLRDLPMDGTLVKVYCYIWRFPKS